MDALSEIVAFVRSNRGNGKRGCFQLDNTGLCQYIKWAFNNGYLLVVLEKNLISGVAVAYPTPKKQAPTVEDIIPKDETQDESKPWSYDLFIMDWLATTSESRKLLVEKFKARYHDWHNHNKWGLHYGKMKHLSNKYIHLLSQI